MAVPQTGQNLHELVGKSCTNLYLRTAVVFVFQYNQSEAERPLTPKYHSASQPEVSCRFNPCVILVAKGAQALRPVLTIWSTIALPRVPHLGIIPKWGALGEHKTDVLLTSSRSTGTVSQQEEGRRITVYRRILSPTPLSLSLSLSLSLHRRHAGSMLFALNNRMQQLLLKFSFSLSLARSLARSLSPPPPPPPPHPPPLRISQKGTRQEHWPRQQR